MRPNYYDRYCVTDDLLTELYSDMEPISSALYCDESLTPRGYAVSFAITEARTASDDFVPAGNELMIVLEFGHWHENDHPLNKFYRGPFAIGELGLDSITEQLLYNSSIRHMRPNSFLPVIVEFCAGNRLSHLVEVPPDEATHLLFHHYEPRSLEPRQFYSEVASFNCGEATGWFTLHEFGTILTSDPYFRTLACETVVRQKLRQAEANFQCKVGPSNLTTLALRLDGYLEHRLGIEEIGAYLLEHNY